MANTLMRHHTNYLNPKAMNNHTKTMIALIKKGELFRLKVDGPVYVRGDYNRSEKKYEAYKWEDVNHFIYKCGEFPVYIGFEF